MAYDVVSLHNHIIFYLSEHPSIVNFRWSSIESWPSTWQFLFISIFFYLFLSLFLRPTRPVPLGPVPAIHSLSMSLISVTILAGILLSTASEIRDTRWFWWRSKTPIQWLLCFPLGTRPSGRVFFWSYVYYLSRFLHMWRTIFSLLRRRKVSSFQIVSHSVSAVTSFLWLEFSQSFQVVAIAVTTLVHFVAYTCRFWTDVGFCGGAGFSLVVNVKCQVVLLVCNGMCHVGVLLLHFSRGGCNGIGAWIFNSVLNGVILLLYLNFYMRTNA